MDVNKILLNGQSLNVPSDLSEITATDNVGGFG